MSGSILFQSLFDHSRKSKLKRDAAVGFVLGDEFESILFLEAISLG
jgi:hypothetical protein